RVVVDDVADGDERRDEQAQQPARDPDGPQDRARAHPRRAARDAPDSSALGMNPRAPLALTSEPKSDESRLDVRITAGPLAGAPLAGFVSREATSKPSMSGRFTSR